MRAKTRIAGTVILAACLVFCIFGCTPKTPSDNPDPPKEGSSQEAIAFEWSKDSDCAVCHAEKASTMTDASYSIMANHSKLQCVACHTDIEGLASAHSEVTADGVEANVRVLKETKIDKGSCSSCHGVDTLHESTAETTVLTDSNGTTVNPHQLPDVGPHSETTCGKCHDMHSTSNAPEKATEYCISCHHTGTYECYTCHEG